MYKAVLFDFFDVIHVDPLRAWLEKIGETRKGRYDEIPHALDLGEIDYDEYVRQLAEVSGQSIEALNEEFEQSASVYPEVVEIIKELGQNYKVGLISNANTDELRPILKRHNLVELFDEIVISSEVQLAKPDAAIFRLMLDRLGIQAGEAIFTDDNQKNVDAATSLGITGIWFEHGEGLRARLTERGIKLA